MNADLQAYAPTNITDAAAGIHQDIWWDNCFVPSSISRFAELGRAFKGGQSDLLNGVARLSVFYEDLRLEMSELGALHRQVIELGKSGMEYRVMYFLRRAVATVVEFRGGLTTVILTPEFKAAKANLSEFDAKCIADADRYLQQNWDQIKDFRNQFARHIRMPGVRFAASGFSNEVGT